MKSKRIIWIINGILFFLLLCALALLFLGGWETTVLLRGSPEITLEYGEQISDPGAEARFSGTFLFKNGISVPVTVDRSQLENAGLGTYTITYSAGVLGASATATRSVTLIDTTPPVIELVSDPDGYTKPGETYQEEGFSAMDLCDGDLTDSVQRTETETTVTYTVSDHSGNTTTVTREIIYDDRVAPVITLEGDMDVTLEKGTSFEEPGYSATDDCDGDITDRVTVSEEPEGFVYTVLDSYGNADIVIRTVTYIDTLPPVLTLSGEGEIWMKAGQTYTEPGYTATDQGDGDVTQQVTVSGEVNCYHAGDYTLTYTATDSAGNSASQERIVHVEPRPQPDTVSPGDKVVYLTFDDGPGKYTQELLDVLEEYNVKVTFFVTGAYPDYQNLIAKAAKAGHAIGLHTYSHKYDEIYASEDAYFQDLNAIGAIVKAQTGYEASLIRFPGGSSNTVSNFTPGIMTSLTQAVTDMGYQYFDWNVDSDDAGSAKDAKTVAWNVCSGIAKNNVSVVLQHDVKSYSVAAVEAILAWGIENGYTFLPLSSTSPTAHHGVNN